jgi:uncharacterized membrane protein YedE/YeeE
VSTRLLRVLGALGAGLSFGAGLVLSGMTRPAKVLAFLDVFGEWDPSLAFVMAGAIAVHALGYRLVRRRRRPLGGDRFHVPERGVIDRRLLAGAALFGVGWGLAGYCPGPAVVALASGSLGVAVFALGFLVASSLGSRLGPGEDASPVQRFSSSGGGGAAP